MATATITKEQAVRIARLSRTNSDMLVQVIERAEQAQASYTVTFPGCHLYMQREGGIFTYRIDGSLDEVLCVLSVFLGDDAPMWG